MHEVAQAAARDSRVAYVEVDPVAVAPARINLRRRADILRLLDGFTLADPGLVYVSLWRPDSPADVPEDPSR